MRYISEPLSSHKFCITGAHLSWPSLKVGGRAALGPPPPPFSFPSPPQLSTGPSSSSQPLSFPCFGGSGSHSPQVGQVWGWYLPPMTWCWAGPRTGHAQALDQQEGRNTSFPWPSRAAPGSRKNSRTPRPFLALSERHSSTAFWPSTQQRNQTCLQATQEEPLGTLQRPPWGPLSLWEVDLAQLHWVPETPRKNSSTFSHKLQNTLWSFSFVHLQMWYEMQLVLLYFTDVVGFCFFTNRDTLRLEEDRTPRTPGPRVWAEWVLGSPGWPCTSPAPLWRNSTGPFPCSDKMEQKRFSEMLWGRESCCFAPTSRPRGGAFSRAAHTCQCYIYGRRPETVHSARNETDGRIRLILLLLATVKICEMVCYSR